MSENVMPQSGDRVRVVLEGTVRRDAFGGDGFYIGGADCNVIYPTAEHVVSIEILSRPMPPLPTEPTPILATVWGVEGTLLIGPNEYGWWYSVQEEVGGDRWHRPEHITAWRPWTPEDAA